MTELGVARYVLLARTGQLLPAIESADGEAGAALPEQSRSAQQNDDVGVERAQFPEGSGE